MYPELTQPLVYMDTLREIFDLLGHEYMPWIYDDTWGNDWRVHAFDYVLLYVELRSEGELPKHRKAMLGLVCSIQDPDIGQKLLEHCGTPNFISALRLINKEEPKLAGLYWQLLFFRNWW